jgi:hypothetical protein
VSYGTSPNSAGALRSVRGISLAVVILTAMTAAATALVSVLSAGVTEDAKRYLNGELSDSDFQSAIAPVSGLQIVAGVGSIATFVVTAVWMFRLASNIRAFHRRTTWAPVFAIFGWVMPPFVFVVPFLMLRELWKASSPDDPTDTERWRKSSENPLLWAWLVLYGLIPFVFAIFSVGSLLNSGFTSDALDATARGLDSYGASNVIALVAVIGGGVVWILFVRQLTARHIQLTNER